MHSTVVTERTQAGGPIVVELGSQDYLGYHQIQVEVSATPTGGTLAVGVRSFGSEEYVDLDGTIDLTGTELLKTFGPLFASHIRITPTSFDGDKTFNVIVTSGAG